MITADQLVAHAIGDYVLQSDWMATKKRSEPWAAWAHAFVYSLPFLCFRPSMGAWLVIVFTHSAIDHFGLARYVVWAKNFLAPRWLLPSGCGEATVAQCANSVRNLSWKRCKATGYPPDRPAWLAVWLLIAADNCLHVLINGLALRFL